VAGPPDQGGAIVSVCVRDVAKTFPNAAMPAVDRVSFTAPDHCITTLLGPSGSGKSTILRMIAGLERPDDGRVEIHGDDVTRVPVQKRRVGFVFQSYALFGHMTVFENVAFGLRLRKDPKERIASRVRELLELVQLADLHARYPGQLSGGQRQRIALARALATEPRVLLLDEPFGALDARVRAELRVWLRELHRHTKLTTILVTHDQEEAFELSEHIVLLHDGRVAQAGSPHDLYDHPANAFVAEFLGGTNVLRGSVVAGRARVAAVDLGEMSHAIDGGSVRAVVRPGDVRVQRQAEGGAIALAVVGGIARIGGQVRVDLQLDGGDGVTVQMGAAELKALAVAVGDRVYVDLGEAKLFLEDYAI